MRFYKKQHKYYCGIDLYARKMYVCILGHALYMKAIHGGKTKNDKTDSYTIARLMKGGNFPVAYPYPAEWRATRDLLRRRMYISRRCGELVAHRRTDTHRQKTKVGTNESFVKKFDAKTEDLFESFIFPIYRSSFFLDNRRPYRG